MSFAPRISGVPAQLIWALWLAFIAWTAVEPTRIHIEYFSKLGEGVATGLVAFLLVGAAGAWLYSSLRLHRELWRFEPLVGGALIVLICGIYQPVGFLVTLVWVWTGFVAGRGLLFRFGLPPNLGLGDAGLASAVGAAWMGVALFGLGAAHLFTRPALVALLLISALIGWKELSSPVRILQHLHRSWAASEELRDRAIGLSVFYLFLFLGFGLAVAVTPAINIDGIREHLRYGQIAVEAGWFQPSIIQRTSYYPQGFEAFLGAAQAFGGQAAAELVNPAFFLGLIAVCYGLARRAGVDRRAAVLGLIVAATVPFLHRTGVIVKNDMLLFLFQLGSLTCWLRARDEHKDRWLWLGVVLLALSIGVKLTAAFGVVALGLLFLWSTWRRPRLLLGLILVGALFGGLWQTRPYLATGNPLYPLRSNNAVGRFPSKGVITRPPLWQIHSVYPWAVHYAGNASYSSPTNNPAGMALPFFVVAWLLVRRRRRNSTEVALLIFCALYYLYWGYVWGVIRYFIGPFLLLAVLTLARAQHFWDAAGPWPRRLGLAALTCNFVFAVPPTMMLEVNLPQLQFLSGRISRAQFLTQAVSGYRVLRELEKRRGPDDEAVSFHMEHLAYAPDQLHITLIYAGSWRRARRNQLVASRQFKYVVVDRLLERQFPTYDGAEDYQRVYQDEAASLWERKPGVQVGEPIVRIDQLAPLVIEPKSGQ